MNRSHFLGAATLAGGTLASAAVSGVEAATIPGGTALVERASDFDAAGFAAKLGRPADIRQVWENLVFKPSVLNNIKNSLNGLVFGFGYAPERIALATANHGPSSSYTFDDYVWQKYRIGQFFELKDASGNPIATNVFFARKSAPNAGASPDDPNGPYQDTSIEALQARGVMMLTCHTAVEEISANIVKRSFAPSGMRPQDVANDILTHLVAGAIVVPSMVATLAVLQNRYAYTFATVQS